MVWNDSVELWDGGFSTSKSSTIPAIMALIVDASLL